MTSAPDRVHWQRLTGRVIAAGRMKNTVRVAVDRTRAIPKIRKHVRRTKVFLVHDPKGEARLGDRVVIVGTRPLSKRKHFRLFRVDSSMQPSTVKTARGAGERTTRAFLRSVAP